MYKIMWFTRYTDPDLNKKANIIHRDKMGAPLQVIALYGASVITPAQARRAVGSNAHTFAGEYRSSRVVIDCATPADVPGALERCVNLSDKHPNAPMVSATVIFPDAAWNTDNSPNGQLAQKIVDLTDLLRAKQLCLQYHPGTLFGPKGPYSTVSVTGQIGNVTLKEAAPF